jgi:TIGR03009 family protein
MLATLLMVRWSAAQQQSRPGSAPAGQRVATRQQSAQSGAAPQIPSLQRRQAPAAPFQLTPYEQAQVDRALQAWEHESAKFRKFECDFTRFQYDKVFGDPNLPRFVDLGYIKYAAPDRGVFRVTHTKQGEKVVPIEPKRGEHWICDGKSIYGYDFVQKQLVQHKLPPELWGKAISRGPLPFLFGAKADRVKQRYWVRIVTPQNVSGQVWLEAYPRFQADAANFQRAELILETGGMRPFALQLHLPGGQQRNVYQFANIEVNTRDPADLLDIFPDNDFRAAVPLGWQKIVEEAEPTREANRPAAAPSR